MNPGFRFGRGFPFDSHFGKGGEGLFSVLMSGVPANKFLEILISRKKTKKEDL